MKCVTIYNYAINLVIYWNIYNYLLFKLYTQPRLNYMKHILKIVTTNNTNIMIYLFHLINPSTSKKLPENIFILFHIPDS